MKDQRKFVLAAISAAVMSIVSCHGGKTVAEATPVAAPQVEERLVFDSAEWHDSAWVHPNGITRVDYRCVYPVKGSKVLKDSIMRWVYEQYGDSAYNGVADVKALLERTGRKTIAADKPELAEILSYRGGDDGYTVEYVTDIHTYVEYEDAEYVTMFCQTYMYRAGAHGSTVNNVVTFSKKDGSRCGWNLLGDMSCKDITDRIKAGLKEVLDITEPDSDAKLREVLFGMSEADYAEKFPLPAFPPFLTKEGVVVMYQQYEIAPYAVGMPSCVIKKP